MCGIAGWADFTQSLAHQTGILHAMTDTLKQRGPDDEGYYLSEHVLLGHRRLVVVDPAGGRQPMVRRREGGDFALVYNGELYNTEELRRELAEKGYEFESYSDTEVLLTAYMEWGEGCIGRLNGIFAFAVYNAREQKLFLARDPLGVKPLFYARRGGSLLFGSELKALLAHPLVKPEVDENGLRELFGLGPANAPGSGVFRDVYEVPPANCLLFTPESMKLWEYWKPTAEENTETEQQASDHLRTLLDDAIRRQLVGDVPLCCFLSGGLDSSAISCFAAREFAKTGRQLTTYSIDYEENDKYFKASLFQPTPDQEWAVKMSEFIGSRHRTYIEQQEEVAAALRDATLARDLPGMADIDSSLLLFCREIRKDFVVALSGECADEILGGYPWFTRPELVSADTFPWSRSVGMRTAVLAPALKSLKLDEFAREHYLGTLHQVPHLPDESPRAFRMRELFYLNIKWFMVNLLNRKDRMSMANSLEVRVPFADYRLVQYAFNLPPELKFLDGREKGLLRRCLKGVLPDGIVERKKSPYPKTHHPAYTDYVCSMMTELLERKSAPLFDIVDRSMARELVHTRGEAYTYPWFGQLMTGPQLIAYLLQLSCWLEEYHVALV